MQQNTNEETVTCRLCGLPIQPGAGTHVVKDFERGQMGWLHFPLCVWKQQALWGRESETPEARPAEGKP